MIEAPWWIENHPTRLFFALHDDAELARTLAALLDPEAPDPPPMLVAEAGVQSVLNMLPTRPSERNAQLRALASRHTFDTVNSSYTVAIPPRLFERLLDRAGVTRAPLAHLSADEGLLPIGAIRGECTEAWGLPGAAGAAYNDALWAWGAVREQGRAVPATLSPRLAWRRGPAGWRVHPTLADAVSAMPEPPRLDEGPGFLLACVLDAVAELARGEPLTGRDQAVLWGTLLLPTVALSRLWPDGLALPVAAERAPDYAQMWPFYLLHPRVQAAVLVIDRLVTLQLSEDHAALHRLLAALGRAPSTPQAAVYDLVAALAERVMHRNAAERWDSGFGFRIFRGILREVLAGGPERLAGLWDDALHAEPEGDDSAVGQLAERLRESMATALWFPGRPPYRGGPVAEQLVDLVWLRWTDPLFPGE